MHTNIIFKGVDFSLFNLNIAYLDRRMRAEEIIIREPIPYGTSDYIVHTGRYRPYERVCRGVLFDLSQKREISAALKGQGILVTSIDEGGYQRVNVISDVRWEKIAPNTEQFEVTFLVNPAFYYLDSGMAAVLLTGGAGTLENVGTATALPLFEITGTGNINVDVNGEVFTITGLSGKLTIDSEIMEVWQDTELSDKMAGKFPQLIPGTNNIAYTGTVTEFRILPRWADL